MAVEAVAEVKAEVLAAEDTGTTQINEDLKKNKRKQQPIKNELMLLKENKRKK